ncbi:MAG: sulfite exporter TauE/SafE family protein [Proteocatella sp.]
MKSREAVISYKIDGMTCNGCEQRIESRLGKIPAIKSVKAEYATGTASVAYNADEISSEEIVKILEKMGYSTGKVDSAAKFKEIGFISFIMIGIYMLSKASGLLNIFNEFPIAQSGMGYATIFAIGVLTSVHCIAMCGGINLSQCVPQGARLIDDNRKTASLLPSFKYNLGRVISYTVIGGIAGALGSAVSFSGSAKGLVAAFAGVFMIIMGLNMLDIFPGLKKFNIRVPKAITKRINIKKQSSTPFYVGLLNGLMPCGPLQAMQLYALSTGSAVQGAVSMFLFSLGTVPFMFGLGVVSSMLSKKFKKRMMLVSAVLVVVLGMFMFQNGISLSGMDFGGVSAQNSVSREMVLEDGKQVVTTEVGPSSYEPIVVQKDIPVKWIINVDEENLNGCNNEILVPKYNLDIKLQPGENIVEFTPTESGTVKYSCWMGMIRSSITVVDDLQSEDALKSSADNVLGTSGGSGGSCCAVELNN